MVTRLILAAAVMVVTLASGGARLNVVQATEPNDTTQAAQVQQPGSMDRMKMHEQMMAEMHAGAVKLDALVKEMNTAKGEAKVNALAAVVTELVGQHKAMHAHMGEMHQHMMGMGGMMMHR